ncbi:MAG TPA: TIGR02186 family protein, partial [Stellaceae bacterium]|nr:TIGR02186 family protein [Stellaceae bacterium]
MRARATKVRLLAPLVFLASLWPGYVQADQPLLADLSSHLIAITTGFTGASVVLFGATDGPGDVVIVVRGPERDMVVRHKSHFAGIWINTRQVTFSGVPSYYAVFSS